MFLLGFITGLLIAIFILLTLTFFRSSIEKRLMIVEKKIMNAGPKPKGFIVEPEDEGTIIRKEIIDKNNKLGKNTYISELE